jgi:hypothetical protein
MRTLVKENVRRFRMSDVADIFFNVSATYDQIPLNPPPPAQLTTSGQIPASDWSAGCVVQILLFHTLSVFLVKLWNLVYMPINLHTLSSCSVQKNRHNIAVTTILLFTYRPFNILHLQFSSSLPCGSKLKNINVRLQ